MTPIEQEREREKLLQFSKNKRKVKPFATFEHFEKK